MAEVNHKLISDKQRKKAKLNSLYFIQEKQLNYLTVK